MSSGCETINGVSRMRTNSPWAARIHDAVARCQDHPHAIRILSRAWLCVIWHC
jgi:hypothetical protein